MHGFTLNLHLDIEALALRQPATASWLRDRIAVELRAALGRSVPLFFGLEQTWRGRLHVHGVLGIAAHEAERARKALRRAGGEWDENRQFQAETEADPDHGWTAYIVKEFFLARPFIRQMMDHANDNHRRRRFQGAVLVASNEVRSLAGKIYDEARNRFMQAKGITRPRSRAKKVWRWPTDVRAMMGSTMLTPLQKIAPVLTRCILPNATPFAQSTNSCTVRLPSHVIVMRPVVPALRCARRRAGSAARRAVRCQPVGSLQRANRPSRLIAKALNDRH